MEHKRLAELWRESYILSNKLHADLCEQVEEYMRNLPRDLDDLDLAIEAMAEFGIEAEGICGPDEDVPVWLIELGAEVNEEDNDPS